jgi:hypothetical protein
MYTIGIAKAATMIAIGSAPSTAASTVSTRAMPSAMRYVYGRSPVLYGMIVDTSRNDATGSSGFAAYAFERPASPDNRSAPQW